MNTVINNIIFHNIPMSFIAAFYCHISLLLILIFCYALHYLRIYSERILKIDK